MKTPRVRVLVALFLFGCVGSWAQAGGESAPAYWLADNAVYATGGIGPPWLTADMSYERRLLSFRSDFWNDIRLKVAFGRFVLWDANFIETRAGIQVIVGTRNHHLEAGVGGMATYDLYYYQGPGSEDPAFLEHTRIWPAGSIGYRFQKPGTSLIIRLGVGFPDGAYLSVGMSF